jgi:hypothetical protein
VQRGALSATVMTCRAAADPSAARSNGDAPPDLLHTQLPSGAALPLDLANGDDDSLLGWQRLQAIVHPFLLLPSPPLPSFPPLFPLALGFA